MSTQNDDEKFKSTLEKGVADEIGRRFKKPDENVELLLCSSHPGR